MDEFVIIVAGGRGLRMGGEIPKQFLTVGGKPILMHTIEAFGRHAQAGNVIVVLPESHIPLWNQLIAEQKSLPNLTVVTGGSTRFHSVKNGLNIIGINQGLVAIHDGVRPLVTSKLIESGFSEARINGSAIASVSLKDSLREMNKEGAPKPLDRNRYRLIQTPQTFRLDWAKQAFLREFDEAFTDCATVVEAAGFPIHLIEGSYDNIKITTPEDLRLAGALLGNP